MATLPTNFSAGNLITSAWMNSVGVFFNELAAALPSGTVTTVSGINANGFSWTITNASSTPEIEVSISVNGILYSANGTLSAAVAGNFPLLNQSTTGNAATATLATNATNAVNATNAANATNATTALNLAGGAANQVPVQAGVGSSTFIPAPTVAGTVLQYTGTGIAWAPINSPNTVPGAPTGVVATAGNASASVTFVAPSSNGGSTITGYTVVSNPAGGTDVTGGTGLTHSVTGLVNGTSYTFTVYATNSQGNGPDATYSSAVTPATIPGAPTIGTATAGIDSASITFSAPGSNGGSPITSYTMTAFIGGSSTGITGSGTTSPITVSGLTAGSTYGFECTATNALGTSGYSAMSNTVTLATVPGVPTGLSATAGNGDAVITFTAPASNGGSSIINYLATAYISGTTTGITGNGTGSPVTVTGLTNGTAYTFKVQAENAVGYGTSSAASNSVTPSAGAGVPNAPTNLTAYASPQPEGAFILFQAPTSNGGASITSYVATSSPGGIQASIAYDSSNGNMCCRVDVFGLTAGTAYTFSVAGVNANGTGTQSAASNSVTPIAYAAQYVDNASGSAASNKWQNYDFGMADTTNYNQTPGATSYYGNTCPARPTVSGAPNLIIQADFAGGGAIQPYYQNANYHAGNGRFQLQPYTHFTMMVYPLTTWDTGALHFEACKWVNGIATTTSSTQIIDAAAQWTSGGVTGYILTATPNSADILQETSANTATTVTVAGGCNAGALYELEEPDQYVGNTLGSTASYVTGPNAGSYTINTWNTVVIPLSAFNINSVTPVIPNNQILKLGLQNGPADNRTVYFSNVGFS